MVAASSGDPVCGDLPACEHHASFISVGGSLPPMGAAGERPEFDIKPNSVAPLLIFP